MKKITSILCALALVLSVSAAPVKSFQKGASVEMTKKELKTRVSAAKNAVKSTDFAKQVKASAIRKAAAASTDVTITSYSSKFYAEDNDVYAALTDEVNGIDFCFDIIVADGLEDFEEGHEYTMADAIADYCYWMDADWNFVDFAEFTFVLKHDADGLINIDATVIDANGDEWVLTYKQPKTPEGGTFSTDDVEGTYYSEDGDIQYALTFGADNLVAYFDFPLAGGAEDIEAGVKYTLADMDAQYTGIIFNGSVSIELASVEFTKTVNGDGSYTITVVAVDANANTWNLSATKPAPVSYDIVVSAGMQFTDRSADQGWWQVLGENADFSFSLSNNNNPTVAGTYDMADMDASFTFVRDLATSTKISFVSGSVVVTVNADESIDFKGAFMDADGNTYNFNLHFVPPTAEATVDVVADATIEQQSSGYFFIQGTDEKSIEVSLYLLSTTLDGTYTKNDLNGNYSGVFDGADINIYSASLTIASTETETTITGSLLCYNNTQYNITLTKKVEPAKEIDIKIATGAVFDDQISAYGWWQIQAQNDDYYVTLSPISTDHIAGTYDVAELDASYSLVYDNATSTSIAFASGSVTVTENADKSIDFVGKFVGEDGNTYNIDIHYADPTPETTKNVTITEGAIYDAYVASDGIYVVYGTSEDNIYTQLAIYADDLTKADYTEEDLDTYIIGSGIEDDGENETIFTAAIHFAIAPNLKDLIMTADLLCYNNTLYKVTMTIPDVVPTGVENVEAESEIIKAIENGQFIIKMNGMKFNAVGARVK